MTVENKKLLKKRKEISARRPKFVRQESWRYKRLKKSWRKPKGIDNKMKEKRKGYPRMVNIGYRGPKAVRGLHPSGYQVVHVANIYELEEVDKELDKLVKGESYTADPKPSRSIDVTRPILILLVIMFGYILWMLPTKSYIDAKFSAYPDGETLVKVAEINREAEIGTASYSLAETCVMTAKNKSEKEECINLVY